MNAHTLAIPFAFILLSGVLCLLLIGSKWKWWQKLGIIVIVPSFGLAIWSAIGSYQGWPTDESPPDKALLLWGAADEGDPALPDDGAIYVWLAPYGEDMVSGHNPLAYASPGREPRAYRLPYSRTLHQAIEKARGMIREGRPVVFGRGGGGGDGEDGDGTPGDGEGSGSGRGGYGYDRNRQDFQVYELPPPQPPVKAPEASEITQ